MAYERIQKRRYDTEDSVDSLGWSSPSISLLLKPLLLHRAQYDSLKCILPTPNIVFDSVEEKWGDRKLNCEQEIGSGTSRVRPVFTGQLL